MPPKKRAASAASTTSETPTVADSGYGSPQTTTSPSGAQPVKKRIRTGAKKAASKEAEYHDMPVDGDGPPLLTVTSKNESLNATMNNASNEFEAVFKIAGAQSFKVTSYKIVDGIVQMNVEYKKPFPLMSLAPTMLRGILKIVLMPEARSNAKIVISNAAGGFRSKNYAEGMKNRLGIIRVNKKIHQEAMPILYGNHIKFDDTKAASLFILRVKPDVRKHLTFLEIGIYKKDSAGMATTALTECPNLRRVHISTNVGVNASPSKAAKSFVTENSYFFHKMGSDFNDPYKGLDIVRFGRTEKCFSIKEGDGEIRRWTKEELAEFEDVLKKQIVK
ncbi:hypothetical protein CAC42_2804 [Sphaceloma murrayae]|uniref:Uncharacterized protein n=1 Tax=Sphaceloma murrayae TaxID=2082308 RepID=A0A2K1R124_9PEZI|nr:hypothetical protein CAC42_2804 [Sphaceloma murrayae]